jgi:HAAS domain-containing protein
MSDREFENYLTLLAGLLRLDGKQRAAIAEELRSHLEDRLEELVARGVSREEAVQQALAEFGDAAGLAGQFGAISRNRKRRWLMRLTTFSVAAILLLAAGLATFWPGRNAAPGAAALIAQAPKAADPFGPPESAAPEKPRRISRPTAAAVIEEKLNKPTTLEVVEMPLKDVVLFLAETHQIPIVLKIKKLEEASVAVDTPITKSLRGIRLATALDLILDDLELAYYISEVLVITTPEDTASRTEVRIYDCRDILAMPAPGADKVALPPGREGGAAAGAAEFPGRFAAAPEISNYDERAAKLMTIITTNVDSNTWHPAQRIGFGMGTHHDRDVPTDTGVGSISEYNGLIVVTQTAHTHKKIEHVLDMLREAAELEVPKAGKVVR